jgi:predicted metalloprotease with PDZ domain
MADLRLEIEDPRAHLLRVSFTLARPAARQRIALAAWAPGSYTRRDFARHVMRIVARQGVREVAVESVDGSQWDVLCDGRGTLTVTLLLYAFDDSVRGAFVDTERGFVNGPAVFPYAPGREHEVQRLTIGRLPAGWEIATAMTAVGPQRFEAADHAELIDHPIAFGRFWRGRFEAGGTPHEVAVTGAWPTFDGARLLEDLRRVCAVHLRFWHGRGKPPFARYLFLVYASENGYGGLEHRASTATACTRAALPRRGQAAVDDAYAGLLALLSHEYFHAWNVVRMTAPELRGADLRTEAHTRLLWFYEGFTSYYDELSLLRAGLVDAPRYLRALARSVNAVQSTPGRQVQSVAQASFDAWTRYYRRDENTANGTVSYYDKGALIALLADLALRVRGRTLDDAMRTLWQRAAAGPVGEAEIAAALGDEVAPDVLGWVHGTAELPLAPRLAGAGVALRSAEPTAAARAGLKLAEGPVTGIQVRAVQRGSAAEAAGVAAGDELLAAAGWRLRRFDDLLQWVTPGAPFELLVARDQRLLALPLQLPPAPNAGTVSLVLDERASGAALALRRAWLGA